MARCVDKLFIVVAQLALSICVSASTYPQYAYVLQNQGNTDLYLTATSDGKLVGQTRDLDHFSDGRWGYAGSSDFQVWDYPYGSQIKSFGAKQYIHYNANNDIVGLTSSASSGGWFLDALDTLQWSGEDPKKYYRLSLNANDLSISLKPLDASDKYQKWRKLLFPDPLLLKRSFYIIPKDNADVAIQANPKALAPSYVYSNSWIWKRSQDLHKGLWQRWMISSRKVFGEKKVAIVLACAPNVCFDVSKGGSSVDILANGARSLLGYLYHAFDNNGNDANTAPWQTWNEEPFKSRSTGQIVAGDNTKPYLSLDPPYKSGDMVYCLENPPSNSQSLWTILPVAIEDPKDPEERIGPFFISSGSCQFLLTLLPPISAGIFESDEFALDVKLLPKGQVPINKATTNVTDPLLFQEWWYYPALQAFKPVLLVNGAIELKSGGRDGIYVTKHHGGWTQRFIFDPDARTSSSGGIYNPSFSMFLKAADSSYNSDGWRNVNIQDIVPGDPALDFSLQWRLVQAPLPPPPPAPLPPPPPPVTETTTIPPPPKPTLTTFPSVPPKTITSCSVIP
jgi:hypothetical protein